MQPHNLLYIISDQHQRDALGCYGHPVVETPHLDALARRGTRFTSAYTNCPICVPARASLATGRYVHQIGHWDNAFPYEGTVPGWGHRLQQAGMRVESIGKLHHRFDEDNDGFAKHHIPLNVVDGVGDVMGSLRDDPPERDGARTGVLQAGPGDSTYLDYDERIAAHSVHWLQEQARRPDDKPWTLFVSFVCPHPPYVAPPELYERYASAALPLPVQSSAHDRPDHPALNTLRRVMQWTEPLPEEAKLKMIAAYLGCCTHLDRQIGKVLEAVEACGLNDSTRIVYTSDHGESLGRRGLWGKFTLYEESAAVPLIVAGPDVPAGRTCDDPVTLVDTYPTVLEAMGLELTADERRLPGDSWWSIAQGNELGRPAFSEYHAVGSEHAWYMFREGHLKLIYYVDAPTQLFDLQQDRDELVNLADDPEFADVRKRMEARLRELVDPEAVDQQARRDQLALVERHGGRAAVLQRGTFTNSPVPGEAVQYRAGSTDHDA